MNAPTEPRCSTCQGMLVHSGAICVVCDDQSHYEAPIRTSPPIAAPEDESGDSARQRLARFAGSRRLLA